MKMFVALISGALLSSAAIAQHEHGVSTGGGNESATQSRESAGEAANGANSVNAAAAATEEGGERRICRRIDRTGSRMGRDQVCMTARQWREYNRND